MGLWLKCPKCQVANPLDLKSCISCNASLENLPAAKRVYVLGDAAPSATPKAAAPKAAAEELPQKSAASAVPAPKPAKKARARRKKQQ